MAWMRPTWSPLECCCPGEGSCWWWGYQDPWLRDGLVTSLMWFADVSNKNTTCVSVDPLSSPNLGQLHGSGSSPSLASSGGGSQGGPSIAPGVPLDCLHSSERHASSDSSRSGARDGAAWRDSPQVLDDPRDREPLAGWFATRGRSRLLCAIALWSPTGTASASQTCRTMWRTTCASTSLALLWARSIKLLPCPISQSSTQASRWRGRCCLSLALVEPAISAGVSSFHW